jgi:LPPG:FO 2-phospho-L-lactate transferase
MAEVVGAEGLSVIVNTGDDIEIYGAHVSPDPDLVSFWLADTIDDRGWGLRDDTFAVMDAMRDLGLDVWFNLGDRDLAWCMERARMLTLGASPTRALAELNRRIGVRSAVLPMSDDAVRTWVSVEGRWRPFQEFMIRDHATGAIEGLEFRGAESAEPSEEVLAAIAGARAIVIGPSNPLASIAPILSVPGIRRALADSGAPLVAVSPIVGGEVLKGPTASFMAYAGLPLSAAGIAQHYGELLSAIVADEDVPGLPTLRADLAMDGAAGRTRLAQETLAFAQGLGAGA